VVAAALAFPFHWHQPWDALYNYLVAASLAFPFHWHQPWGALYNYLVAVSLAFPFQWHQLWGAFHVAPATLAGKRIFWQLLQERVQISLWQFCRGALDSSLESVACKATSMTPQNLQNLGW
jgi:hypothetical protein